jgi:hypothetical protein
MRIIIKYILLLSSGINAVRREMQQLMEEGGYVPASESRTSVEPVNKTKPGQENLSEKPTPKERLPP